VERGAVRGGPAAADERRVRSATNLEDEVADRFHGWRAKRTDGYPDCVQHADLELLERHLAQVVQPGTFHKSGKLAYLGHGRGSYALNLVTAIPRSKRPRATWKNPCARRALLPRLMDADT
jgi:hypothetical protein